MQCITMVLTLQFIQLPSSSRSKSSLVKLMLLMVTAIVICGILFFVCQCAVAYVL